jgi:hypothetical protein
MSGDLQQAPKCSSGYVGRVDSSSSFVAPLAAPTGVGGRVCVNDERLSHLRSVGVTFSTLAFSTVSLDECSSAAT